LEDQAATTLPEYRALQHYLHDRFPVQP
jgi:hypothetical protein